MEKTGVQKLAGVLKMLVVGMMVLNVIAAVVRTLAGDFSGRAASVSGRAGAPSASDSAVWRGRHSDSHNFCGSGRLGRGLAGYGLRPVHPFFADLRCVLLCDSQASQRDTQYRSGGNAVPDGQRPQYEEGGGLLLDYHRDGGGAADSGS